MTVTSPSFPSRQFLVQQAVLNAAANHLPWTFTANGRRAAVQKLAGLYPPYMQDMVRDEFRALLAQYSVAP